MVMVGASILSAIGWWIGSFVGFTTAFVISTIFGGIGIYIVRRLIRDYLA